MSWLCETKLFQNYFSLRRRPSEIILFRHMKTWLKLFQNNFTGLLRLMNVFQHVQCRWTDNEIILEFLQRLKKYTSVSDVVTCKMKHWNNFEIISVFYIRCNQLRWLHVKQSTEIILKLFQNNFISHVTIRHTISEVPSIETAVNAGRDDPLNHPTTP